MLITRGFGTCSGGTPGEPIYVPITDPKTLTSVTGKNVMTASSRLPSFNSGEETFVPIIKTDTKASDTSINIENLTPKITTNTPKF